MMISHKRDILVSFTHYLSEVFWSVLEDGIPVFTLGCCLVGSMVMLLSDMLRVSISYD